tara:strand:- start:690 stop:797 length:108 start_codon:yes stop_codon:yes gene_type:complete
VLEAQNEKAITGVIETLLPFTQQNMAEAGEMKDEC